MSHENQGPQLRTLQALHRLEEICNVRYLLLVCLSKVVRLALLATRRNQA